MANVSEPSYPREFHAIILALREDGTPLTIDKGTARNAELYRLQFYNFLKWAKRAKNASATVHLAGRQNMVGLSVKDSKVSFILKNGIRFKASEDDVMRQLAAQGVDLESIKVPDSHNNKAFRTHKAKNEVPSLMPEYYSDAPTPLPAAPVYVPTPGVIGFGPPPDILAEMLKPREAPPPLEREIVETQWFPATLRTSSAQPHGPQDKAQWVMNKLVFECAPATLPYPTARSDSHEVSEVNTGKREAEWQRFIMDMEWEACVAFRKVEGAWVFYLTTEADNRLRSQGISFMVRTQADGDLELKNQLRSTVVQLFKGL